jgi:hypothetical protein
VSVKLISRRSSVSIVTRLQGGRPGFDFRQGLGFFIPTPLYRPALGLTQSPLQSVMGALSQGVKRPGRDAYHSLPSSAEFKNAWSYTSTPPVRLHDMVLG